MVSESAGRDLPDRVRLVRCAGGWTDRFARHPAALWFSARDARRHGRTRFLVCAHRFLDRLERRHDTYRLDRGRGVCHRSYTRLLPANVFGGAANPLSLDLDGRPGFLVLPMGHFAHRGGLPCDLPGRVAGPHVAFSMAAIPADVHVRPGEAAKRRLDLAQPHRHELPLPNATFADTHRLVHVSTPRLVSEGFHSLCLIRGAAGSVPDLRSVQAAAHASTVY